MANQNFFLLLPQQLVGDSTYQDLLLVVMAATGIGYLFRKRYVEVTSFRVIAALMLVLALGGAGNAYFQGQPLILGIKAAKGYFYIFFYFIFVSKSINTNRLAVLIIAAGVILSLLNNIQYVAWGKLEIFDLSGVAEQERSGALRLIVGDFFTICAPLVAMGEYLKKKNKLYLIACVYMIATVVFQGQTRAVMFGLAVAVLAMLFWGERVRAKAVAIVAILFVALFVGGNILTNTAFVNMQNETVSEVTMESGSVGIRLQTYEYYWNQLKESPIIGKGIWNDIHTDYNPQDMKFMGMHLADIGIMSLLFNMGLLGAVWLVLLLIIMIRIYWQSVTKLKEGVEYWVVGYIMFSVSTMITLNGFTDRYTIIYLALALAITAQYPKIQRKYPAGR